MRYKVILVHVDLSRHAAARIKYAVAIAGEHGAHLIGAAMTGVSRVLFPKGYDVVPGTMIAGYFEPLQQNAQRALAQFEAIASSAGVSHEPRLICDLAGDGLAMLSCYCDLVVLSQDDPDESLPDPTINMPQHVVLNTPRPVLIVPLANPPERAPRTVLVAWNGSKEATMAVSGAMPLLQRATTVTIASFKQPGDAEPSNVDQHAGLNDFLGHHAVHALSVFRHYEGDAGDAILSLGAELRCDLLVMGCYGHSQFRELCLGGASRNVLRSAGLPLLMAH